VDRKYRIARWLGHQYWLRGRGRLISSLFPPEECTGQQFDIDFFGHRYHGLLDDFIDRHVYIHGGWEIHVLALMSQLASAQRKMMHNPVTYVDVGANTGHHALFMSSHADSVICFEPFGPVRSRLEERIVCNSLENVSVEPVALSAKEGISFYYSPEGNNQGTGSLVPEFSALVGNRSEPAEIRTEMGDTHFSDPDTDIAVLKIDVEGGEKGVLEGFQNTLRRCRPAVVLELSEHTKADFGSLAQLYRLVYPDAVVLTIEPAAWRAGYKLRECDFVAPSDILILPKELAAFVPRSGSFAALPASHVRHRTELAVLNPYVGDGA
jgi:FkbM family methyltransferase